LDIAAFVEDAPPERVFLEHSPNWFSTACLSYEFDPTATCPLWDEVLAEMIGDEAGKLELAQEFIGYVLSPSNNRSKFLALEGEGGNGKSVFTNAIKAIIGSENTSSVGLDVIGRQFQSFPTLGKMLNICQEANDIEGPAESFLKNFTGGNPLMFESKGSNAFEALPTAKLLLTWNIAPRFKDRSEGLWRRMLVLKFNRKPAIANPDLLELDYWERNGQLPGMLNWALLGLKRLESQREFTITDESKRATESIRTANNSARLFIAENLRYRENAIQLSKDVYAAYSKWCSELGMHPMNEVHFGREIHQFFRGLVEKKKRGVGGFGRAWCYMNLEIDELAEDLEPSEPIQAGINFEGTR
jgi:P4 family phage/plasmid primase-like protien